MMVKRVRKVSNPHRRRAKSFARKTRHLKSKNRRHGRNPKRRRNMTDKQVRHFGTKAQRAALKRKANAHRRHGKVNRHRMSKRNTGKRRRRNIAAGFYDEDGYFHPIRASYDYSPSRAGESSRKSKGPKKSKGKKKNPAFAITLGALNPHKKRRKTVAKNRKRNRRYANAHPRHARRNTTRVVVMRKKLNAHRRHNRRMNPNFFGREANYVEVGKYVAGVLVGVAATKAALPMLPASITGSNGMKFISSVGIALAAGYAASFISKDIGSAVMIGGLAQAASVGLNAFIPSVGGVLGLSGFGDFVPASFPVPQVPITISGASRGLSLQSPSRRTAYGAAY